MDQRKMYIFGSALLLAGCAAVKMPSNVAVDTRGAGSGAVRSVDFSYTPARQTDYKRLKLCVAENVSNDAVTLSGDAHIVATRWGIIQGNDTNTVGGGDVFKYADDENQVLIVNGTTEGGGDGLGIVTYKVKYQLRGEVRGDRVELVFRNIKQAQTNTGFTANTGFSRVGTWVGGRAMSVYSALQNVAEQIKECL